VCPFCWQNAIHIQQAPILLLLVLVLECAVQFEDNDEDELSRHRQHTPKSVTIINPIYVGSKAQVLSSIF